jgi:3D (Asp-Asp-Asp) domain-containing protein
MDKVRPKRSRIWLFGLLGLLLAALPALGRADDFGYPKPQTEALKKLRVQISEYHIVFAKPGHEIELLGPGDRPLGVMLSRQDFCEAALQGTVEIKGVRYSVAGKGRMNQASCAPPEFDCPRCTGYALGKNRFVRVDSDRGLASKTYGLVAYRTVAVRAGGLPLGTVLYIPAARGLRMPDGKRHDGYFFVADIGAMRSTQLDLFADTHKLSWSIIGSGTASSRTSTAYIVTDPLIVKSLKAAHVAAADAAAEP